MAVAIDTSSGSTQRHLLFVIFDEVRRPHVSLLMKGPASGAALREVEAFR